MILNLKTQEDVQKALSDWFAGIDVCVDYSKSYPELIEELQRQIKQIEKNSNKCSAKIMDKR